MTRNENPNPEIGWASKVPDNHRYKSSRHINLWLEEASQTVKHAEQKLKQKRGATLWMGKDATLVSGLYRESKRLQWCRGSRKTHPHRRHHSEDTWSSPPHSKGHRGQSQPCNLLGLHAGSAKKDASTELTGPAHSPLHDTLGVQMRGGLGEKRV